MINQEEVRLVASNMINWGGSFVRTLGEALIHADSINQQKIKDAFAEYWEQYKTMGVKK